MKLIAGTRGSKLAVAQTDLICNMLKEKFPNIEIEKKIIKTKGDKILNKALDKIGDKGIFVKEIENQLMDGKIDFAVHSLKDMPSVIDENLKLTKTPNRADVRDVLVINPKHQVEDVMAWLKKEKNLKVGTGSKRRIAQLLKINKNIEIMPIRGNIDTRIKKLVDEDMDAIVLAAAGMERLGIVNENEVYYFEYNEMIPASGQGALAIEIRKDNEELDKMFDEISTDKTEFEIIAERSFLKEINGGCHIPVGSISEIKDGRLYLTAIYGSEDYKKIVSGKKSIELLDNPKSEDLHKLEKNKNEKINEDYKEYLKINFENAEKIGVELAEELIEKINEV